MTYVVDTNVLCAASPTRRDTHREVADWLIAHADMVWTSAVCVTEIAFGVERLRLAGAGARARALQEWMNQLLEELRTRILPCNTAVCLRAGELMAQAEKHGLAPGVEDAIVAATAERAGMIVLTRNVRHFRALSVPFENPFG